MDERKGTTEEMMIGEEREMDEAFSGGEGNTVEETQAIEQGGVPKERAEYGVRRDMAEEVRRKKEARVENLLSQGFDEEFAHYIAAIEMENAREKAAVPGWGEEPRAQSGWDSLYSRYPEAAERGMPAEALHEVRCGASPVEAYQRCMITEMKKQMAEAQRKERNSRISMGRADGGAAMAQDAFLREFMKD
ncbi:MAG TPA: hypothetical protein DEB31_00920 [Clostridiales bacterium]|nr:hypothetical protein [Clostridiales bacterium]